MKFERRSHFALGVGVSAAAPSGPPTSLLSYVIGKDKLSRLGRQIGKRIVSRMLAPHEERDWSVHAESRKKKHQRRAGKPPRLESLVRWLRLVAQDRGTRFEGYSKPA